jgi:hypothetical protein
MERRMMLAAGLGLLLLVSVALGDSLPAVCPDCNFSNLKAYYSCPSNPNHDFTVQPAWWHKDYWPPACDWHCPSCSTYPCVNDSIICMTPLCAWEWHRP